MNCQGCVFSDDTPYKTGCKLPKPCGEPVLLKGKKK